MDLPEDMLFAAISANARSLRHIYFENMIVKTTLVQRMTKLPDLQLETMRVMANYDIISPDSLIREESLVRYLNVERDVDDRRDPNTGDNPHPPTDQIYCMQFPQSHPDGHPTKLWKFMPRDGEVADDITSWGWLEEWDPEVGDQEEPTPYCEELQRFDHRGAEGEYDSLWFYLGQASPAWECLKNLKLPEGAMLYDHDPMEEDHCLWD